MKLVFEQECPQCGGSVELAESDHILTCPFCGTQNFLVAKGLHRYILPHKETNLELIHIPYIRFRGSMFNCNTSSVTYKVADLTNLGVSLDFLPHTLGVRPQAMKMQFANPNQPGTFLSCTIKPDIAINRANKHSQIGKSPQKILHQTYIGETVSIIYLPIAVDEDRVFDAITGDQLAILDSSKEIFARFIDGSTNWKPVFLATICPDCGWNLEGEKDSIVLSCSNCQTFWSVENGKFTKVPFLAAASSDNNVKHIPFWRITVEESERSLKSYADLIRSTNQPKVVQEKWHSLPLHFWIPAFKIKPKAFLRLATQMTFSQEKIKLNDKYPVESMHQINLGSDEAGQALKPIYMNSAVNKKDIGTDLPNMKFKTQKVEIVFIPFSDHSYSLYNEMTGININRQVLRFGTSL